ncbi:histidinol phosphate phosphatase [Clostridia bacterium]|nr:histidinol phosphate phosphatase [Clostridia bacterium]
MLPAGENLNFVDTHMHTNLSNDADKRITIDAYCVKAAKVGFNAIAITEHIEMNAWEKDGFVNTFEKSMTANTKAKEKYPFLISGIEMGQATQNIADAEKVLQDKRLDFVIGSIHELPGREDFAFLNFHNVDVNLLLRENFLEILRLCKWGKFDVLGHLTYVLRYMSKAGITVDLRPYNDIIAEAFKTIIAKGKGIEINVSGYRADYGKTFPTLKYVKLFKDLGGDVITVGSDSHAMHNFDRAIRSDLKKGAQIALDAGFQYYTVFREHKPTKVKIET